MSVRANAKAEMTENNVMNATPAFTLDFCTRLMLGFGNDAFERDGNGNGDGDGFTYRCLKHAGIYAVDRTSDIDNTAETSIHYEEIEVLVVVMPDTWKGKVMVMASMAMRWWWCFRTIRNPWTCQNKSL